MSRRLEPLTLDNLGELPSPCRACVFWELDPVAARQAKRTGDTELEKEAWLSQLLLDWGADVNASNIAASRWTWNTVGKSEPGLMNASSAVLVSQDSQSYALTAPALAGKKHGPVLLTSATSVSSS